MEFRDSDGRITIDEAAAQKDIKQLRLSIEKMETALNELNEILVQAEEFSGNTGTQIREASMILIKDIQNSIKSSEDAIDQIQKTVNKYQRLDQEIKGIVNSSAK